MVGLPEDGGITAGGEVDEIAAGVGREKVCYIVDLEECVGFVGLVFEIEGTKMKEQE